MRWIALLLALAFPAHAAAAVIFEDNFDAWTTGWSEPTYVNPIDSAGIAAGWDTYMWDTGTISATCNGSSRPFAGGLGITASGYSGKAMQMPRSSCDANGYYGTLRIGSAKLGSNLQELYVRWYVKFENGFDKTEGGGCKLMDRMTLSSGNALYMGLQGGAKISTAPWSLNSSDSGSYFYTWQPLWDVASYYNDHAWHALEIRVKLNTTGNSNGIVQTWLDGTLQYDYSNIVVSSTGTTDHITEWFFGLGNCSDEAWDQAQFKSMYYDEFIISDTYNGPLSSPSGGNLVIILANWALAAIGAIISGGFYVAGVKGIGGRSGSWDGAYGA